jgi:hypothetical protein
LPLCSSKRETKVSQPLAIAGESRREIIIKNMTGSEIISTFGQLIDQEGNNPLDEIFAYQLLNTARIKLENMADWEYLKSKWPIVGTSLPTNFIKPYKIISQKAIVPLHPYEDYEAYDDGYYINYGSRTINAISQYSSPILTYKSKGADITSATEPSFDSQFHILLAFEMAYIYQSGIDGDDLNFRMAPIHLSQRNELQRLMISWDSGLKAANMNGITEYDIRYINTDNKITLSDA